MNLAIKTRDTGDKDYMYEVHSVPCSHNFRNTNQTYMTDKYNSPEELIKADMENDIPRSDYRIMPCAK